MSKNCALIIKENETFTAWQTFCFYHFPCDQKSSLYNKIVEIYPSMNSNFYLLHLPRAEKKHQLKYLTQYIKNFSDKLGTKNIFFEKNSPLQQNIVEKKNDISCVIHYDKIEFLKKYAKQNKVPLKESRIILLCDHPLQAESFLRNLCCEVLQIELYCKNVDQYHDMIQYFFSEYGILLKAKETIADRNKKNTLVLSVSEDISLIKRYFQEEFLPILNGSKMKHGIRGVYEDAVFCGNREINLTAEKCGGFYSDVLLFLYQCFQQQHKTTDWKDFFEKFDIKCIKILKND